MNVAAAVHQHHAQLADERASGVSLAGGLGGGGGRGRRRGSIAAAETGGDIAAGVFLQRTSSAQTFWRNLEKCPPDMGMPTPDRSAPGGPDGPGSPGGRVDPSPASPAPSLPASASMLDDEVVDNRPSPFPSLGATAAGARRVGGRGGGGGGGGGGGATRGEGEIASSSPPGHAPPANSNGRNPYGGSNQGRRLSDTSRGSSSSADATAPHGVCCLCCIEPPVHPNSTNKLRWDGLVGCLVLYSVLIVPWKVGFDIASTDAWIALDLMADTIFFVDMCITFNTGYFADAAEDILVTDRRRITLHYLRGWFFIDLVSTLPFDYLVSAASTGSFVSVGSSVGLELRLTKLARGLRLFRLAKLFSVSVKVRRLHKAANRNWDINPAFGPLFKMVGFIVYALHVIGCGWYFVCTLDPASTRDNWIGALEPQIQAKLGEDYDGWVSEAWSWYIYSVYWAASTMFAVGYGDIHPTNSAERFYAVMTQVSGAMVFGYIIGTISFLAEVANPRATALKKRTDELKDWMSARHLTISLRRRIRSHMKYVWAFRSLYNEVNILENLSGDLRRRLVFQSYEEVIMSVRLLRWQGVDGRLIELIVTSSRPQIAKVGDYILRAGAVVHGLFALRRGHVHCLACAQDSTERERTVGAYEDGADIGGGIRRVSVRVADADASAVPKSSPVSAGMMQHKRNSLSMRLSSRLTDVTSCATDGYTMCEADSLPSNVSHQHSMHCVATTICDLLMIPNSTMTHIRSHYGEFYRKFRAIAKHRQKLIDGIDRTRPA